MKHFYGILLMLMPVFLTIMPAQAQTTLAAGDIAIIGYNYDAAPQELTIVTLVPITSGTTIFRQAAIMFVLTQKRKTSICPFPFRKGWSNAHSSSSDAHLGIAGMILGICLQHDRQTAIFHFLYRHYFPCNGITGACTG